MKPTIQIGAASLYLADCKDLLPIIGEVDALVADPPYLINTSGGGIFRKNRHNMDDIAAAGIDKGFDINIINPSLYKTFVTFCHNDQIHIVSAFMAQHYDRYVGCGWRKTNPMPVANKHYQPETEPYFHAWKKGAHPLGDSLADMKRIVDAPVGKSPYDHPTVKPDKVMDKILKNVNGETVIDPFMGTGSTGIAALKLGKKFIGIENNPKFFAIACRRFFALYSVEMANAV